MIYRDLWGSYNPMPTCDTYYFLTMSDDCSRAVWIHLIAKKGEVGGIIKDLSAMIETQFHKIVKFVNCDQWNIIYLFEISFLGT